MRIRHATEHSGGYREHLHALEGKEGYIMGDSLWKIRVQAHITILCLKEIGGFIEQDAFGYLIVNGIVLFTVCTQQEKSISPGLNVLMKGASRVLTELNHGMSGLHGHILFLSGAQLVEVGGGESRDAYGRLSIADASFCLSARKAKEVRTCAANPSLKCESTEGSGDLDRWR